MKNDFNGMKKSKRYIINQKIKYGWKPKPKPYTNKMFLADIEEMIQTWKSSQQNQEFSSRVLCHLLYLFDQNFDNIFSNTESILKNNNLECLFDIKSNELGDIFEKTVFVKTLELKDRFFTHFDATKEFQIFTRELFNDCMRHKLHESIPDEKLQDKYPNIYSILMKFILPIVDKYSIIQKLILVYDSVTNGMIKLQMPRNDTKVNSESSNTFFYKSFVSLMCKNTNYQKAISFNIYTMLLRNISGIYLDLLHKIANILVMNHNEIDTVCNCIIKNPQFVKRETKKYLHNINASTVYEKNMTYHVFSRYCNIHTDYGRDNNESIKKKWILKKSCNHINSVLIYSKCMKALNKITNNMMMLFSNTK